MTGVTHAAHAAVGPLGMACTDKHSTDVGQYTMCTGLVPSFDGTPLDVDLTVPAGQLHDHLPLLVMVDGWGTDKTEWESDSFTAPFNRDHWNTAWFVAHGYAVVTYSNRGVAGSCGMTSNPATWLPGQACATGWNHFGDRRFELHDLKYLAGSFVDAGVGDGRRVGVTGFSYGGMHSMLAAVEGDVVTNPDGTLSAWRSPAGTPVHLAAAVPRAGLSDVADLVAPNGRAADGVILADGDRRNPVGVLKATYIASLFAAAGKNTRYPPPGIDPDNDSVGNGAALFAGEPYQSNQIIAATSDASARFRSAYYQDDLIARDVATHDEVPIMFVQGWTDEITTASQATTLAAKLLRADPAWPIRVYLADIGHAPSRSRAVEWIPANLEATAFLDHYLKGTSTAVPLGFTARVSTCDDSLGNVYTAPTLAGLARRRVTFSSSQTQVTTSATNDPVSGYVTDPLTSPSQIPVTAGTGPPICITDTDRRVAGAGPSAIWQWPVTHSFTMLGMPVVALDANVVGIDAEVNARLWDVAPDGTRTLVDRGAYRYVGSGGPTTIRYALFGNGWQWLVGHQVQLEITQNDAPFLRPDNLPSSITYHSAQLTIPTREDQ